MRGQPGIPVFSPSSMKSIDQLNVAVLAGGPGNEREVSLSSAAGVVEALKGGVRTVTLVDVEGPDFELPKDTDVAFNVIHGTYGEDGDLQAELAKRGVPFTGAREASSRLAFDKIGSKKQFREAGVQTPKEWIVGAESAGGPAVALPCVVKPPKEGSSVGVHIVRTEAEWKEAVEDCARYGDEILVEEFIEGKELTVGIVGDQVLPVIHICPKEGFYDMTNKYQAGKTEYFCPADLSPEVTEKVRKLALEAHKALGIEIYSRVDVLLRDSDQEPFVLEINTIPGMTPTSLLPKAAREIGMEYDELCLKIIKLSLNSS